MSQILTQKFFNRQTEKVARELLGKFLVRRYRGKTTARMITEVEVYDGFNDKASHAARGPTKRNAPMFGPAGHWYIYFTYGMHWMLNIVTREAGYPAAVLIRGVQGANGPARLTRFFKIDKKLNGLPATKESGLWVEDRRVRVQSAYIKKGPRMGVGYAGPYWARRRLRLRIV